MDKDNNVIYFPNGSQLKILKEIEKEDERYIGLEVPDWALNQKHLLNIDPKVKDGI